MAEHHDKIARAINMAHGTAHASYFALVAFEAHGLYAKAALCLLALTLFEAGRRLLHIRVERRVNLQEREEP